MDNNHRESLMNHYMVPNGKVDDVRPEWMKEELSTGVSTSVIVVLLLFTSRYACTFRPRLWLLSSMEE